ncbi:MAG TPA: 12-oxophytodienoate reductase [Hyphomicrobiales bacterium]|nr:12-oxophytodienoate reductase [Hyphomicrobiales bacterium]
MAMPVMAAADPSALFTPFRLNGATLKNRIVMPGMQRKWCAEGRPLPQLVEYYCRRAEGGAALIITEACAVDHDSATQEETYARITPETAASWRDCIARVHEAGSLMLIQLWHEGAIRSIGGSGRYAAAPTLSPSGLVKPGKPNGRAATLEELAGIRDAFVRSARLAAAAGADGVEIHACHGYLLDQFLWRHTNLREDRYGGPALADRLRFPVEIVEAVRDAVPADFIVSFRFSQWKEADYGARIAETPDELAFMLDTLKRAGADVVHASARRFWVPEWPGSPLGIAGWVKAVGDLPVIACGSVGLDTDVMDNFLVREARQTGQAGLDEVVRRFENGEFDLMSVGRAHIGDPDWAAKVRDGRVAEIRSFTRADIMPATRDAAGTRHS